MIHLLRNLSQRPLMLAALATFSVAGVSHAQSTHVFWTESWGGKVTRAELDGSNAVDVVAAKFVYPQSISLNPEDGMMYWSDYATGKIQRANLDGSGIEEIMQVEFAAAGVVVDAVNQKLYFLNRGEIYRSNVDGTDGEALVQLEGPFYTGVFDLALDTDNSKMYWVVGSKVQRANLDGTDVELVADETEIPRSVELDVAAGKVYWSNSDAIRRANLDGSNPEDVTTDVQSVSALAVDPANAKVYWVAGDRMIRRANLDGTQVEDVGSTGRYAYDLTIDSGAGRLYWTTPRTVGSVNVDGTDTQDLITTPTTEPQQLYIDQANGKMYWIDGPGFAIQRANLDGTEIEDVVVSTGNPRSFTVGNQKIYWLHGGTLRSTNLDGTGTEDLVTGLSFVTSLVVHEDQGKLYWTTNDGKVQRANVDGTDVEDLVTGLSGPSSLTLDLNDAVMYWGVSGKIQRATMSGTGVTDIVTGLSLPYGVIVDAAGGKVYWTDANLYNVQRANLDGTEIEELAADLRTPWGIALGSVNTTAIENETAVPEAFVLEQNYPNPFNPETTIQYSLKRTAGVSLRVYNLLGVEVATLVDRQQPAGSYNVSWNGTDGNGQSTASGVYLYRLEADGAARTRSMLLLK